MVLAAVINEAARLEGAREHVEVYVISGVQWLRLGVETIGAAIIGIGVAIAVGRFAASLILRHAADFTAIRLTLARYLALGLEFQLGADILSTAVAPTWEQIGKLGAIAVLRTALNYFLSREMRDERATLAAERHVEARADVDLSTARRPGEPHPGRPV